MRKATVSLAVLLTAPAWCFPALTVREEQTATRPTAPRVTSEDPGPAKPAPVSSSHSAEAADLVAPKSKKPLYAKVAMDEGGSKVLSVMYDESQGTGEGYDLLYADVNFDGTFEQAERIEKTFHPATRSTGALPVGWEGWAFSPISLNVPFNEKGEGVPDPCKITLRYQKHPIIAHIRRIASETKEREFIEVFEVLSEIQLRQDSTVWEYSFEGNMKPSESLESAPIWSFEASPKLEITTRPDGRKEGNLGIALNVPAGEKRFQCKKAGQPPKAHVEIKRPDGTIVHKGDETLDKFRFG
jgi:hypothetical protein